MKIGIDLGGTKIEIIALDGHGRERLRQRIATPKDDYGAILASIKQLVAGVEKKLGDSGSIGICTPGAISPRTGLLKNSNSICLNGQPFKRDLEKTIGREVRIANDANCFALSEAVDGTARDCELVFGVIVGTGTGGGVVVRQQVLIGTNAIAGEWGHNPLPWPQPDELPGPECYCGKRGCVETFLSGPGVANDHFAASGSLLSADEIAGLAANGDEQAKRTLLRYEDRMARGLAQVINIIDPDVIVLGGGLSNIKSLYRHVPARWGQYVFSDHVATRLLPPEHGDSSGVRGAAWLWND